MKYESKLHTVSGKRLSEDSYSPACERGGYSGRVLLADGEWCRTIHGGCPEYHSRIQILSDIPYRSEWASPISDSFQFRHEGRWFYVERCDRVFRLFEGTKDSPILIGESECLPNISSRELRHSAVRAILNRPHPS